MSERNAQRLRIGTVSPVGIVFMVVATAAPLTAMATALPLVVGLGNGVGAPGSYLLVALVLALFAVGYAAMSAHMTNAGAFYAYVTAGLGRPLGMAAGLIAVLAYNVLTLYVVGLVGFFAHQTFVDELGVDLPWWLYGGVALGTALVLGIRGLELNVRVLGFLLIVETTLLMVFNVATLARSGTSVLPPEAFSPSQVFSGSPGIALLFAVTCFIGFEATAIFGEEARDPRRTIPRATYLAIAFVGTLYVLTAWLIVGTNGGTNAGAVAAKDPGVYTFDALSAGLGGWSDNVVPWLLLTSLLAVLISLHNMSSRYLMAFGRDRVLPSALARTHPRFQTPYVAGYVQAAATALVAAVYAFAGADPYLNLGLADRRRRHARGDRADGRVLVLGAVLLQPARGSAAVAARDRAGGGRAGARVLRVPGRRQLLAGQRQHLDPGQLAARADPDRGRDRLRDRAAADRAGAAGCARALRGARGAAPRAADGGLA